MNIGNNNKLVQSKEIICPEFGDKVKIKIEEYKIILYECKNEIKLFIF